MSLVERLQVIEVESLRIDHVTMYMGVRRIVEREFRVRMRLVGVHEQSLPHTQEQKHEQDK